MTFASVFTGIGGFDLAFERAGMQCLWQCEIDRQCREVLRYLWPERKIYEDIQKLASIEGLPRPDVLCGGSPCQAFSLAGLRKGLADPRGNLALVFLQVIDKLRPTWVVWENVPGVHSSWSDAETHPAGEESQRIITDVRRLGSELGINDIANLWPGDFEEVDQTNDFDCFLGGLEELGYGVATRILDAQYFGLAQRRERVFVVGHIGANWQRAAALLFDGSCLRGDPPPSRESREGITGGVAPSLNASGRDTSRAGESRGQDCVIPVIADCLQERDSKGSDSSTKNGHLIPEVKGQEEKEVVPIDMQAAFQPRIGRNGHSADMAESGTVNALNMAIRRLTPTECSKLQGFPEGWNKFAISERTGKVYEQADGPRYRQLGNAVAVPVVEWIGKRIVNL